MKTQHHDPLLGALHDYFSEETPKPKTPSSLRHYFMENGVLCCHYKDSATGIIHSQYAVSGTLQATVFRKTYNLGHLGIKKTLDAVKFKF